MGVEIFNEAIQKMGGPRLQEWWEKHRDDLITSVLGDKNEQKILENLPRRPTTVEVWTGPDAIRRATTPYLSIAESRHASENLGTILFNDSPVSKPWELDGALDWMTGDVWIDREIWCSLAYLAVRTRQYLEPADRAHMAQRILAELPAGILAPRPKVQYFWAMYWGNAVLWGPESYRMQVLQAMLTAIDDPKVNEGEAEYLAVVLAKAYGQLVRHAPYELAELCGEFLERNEYRFGGSGNVLDPLIWVSEVLYARRYHPRRRPR